MRFLSGIFISLGGEYFNFPKLTWEPLTPIYISLATDEGPSPKLALSEGGSRGNIEKLAANVIQTRPLQSPSDDLNFVVT